MKLNVTASDAMLVYINQVEETDIVKALNKSERRLMKCLKSIPHKKIDHAYADGKWTIRELLQHMIDAERVFTFRAVWFARRDPQPLPGFDEKSWAAAMDISKRNWKDMISEFKSLRKATIAMFETFTEEDLTAIGTASGNQISVTAIGFVVSGHINHHVKIINERYLQLK